MFEPSVKVSVIVPVYKVEDYLVPCLDSILNQLFRDIEILLIDDGSPDKCGVICDEYAKKDNRVKVVHQPNSGVTAARRRGVEIARGEFIFFVDADDTLPVNSIQALYDFACRNSLDIAMGAYVEIDETGKRGREVHYLEGVYSGEVFLNELLKGASGVPWGNLYRTTLFDSKVLDLTPEIRRSEDFIMKTRLALRANLVGGTPEVIYYYLQRTTSVVHTFKSSFEYEKMYNELLFRAIKERGLYEKLEPICIAYMLSCLRRVLTDRFNPRDPWLMEIREAMRRLKFPMKKRCFLFLYTNSIARYFIRCIHHYHVKDRGMAIGRGIRNMFRVF